MIMYISFWTTHNYQLLTSFFLHSDNFKIHDFVRIVVRSTRYWRNFFFFFFFFFGGGYKFWREMVACGCIRRTPHPLPDPPPLGHFASSHITFGDIEKLGHFQKRSIAKQYDMMNNYLKGMLKAWCFLYRLAPLLFGGNHIFAQNMHQKLCFFGLQICEGAKRRRPVFTYVTMLILPDSRLLLCICKSSYIILFMMFLEKPFDIWCRCPSETYKLATSQRMVVKSNWRPIKDPLQARTENNGITKVPKQTPQSACDSPPPPPPPPHTHTHSIA